MAITLHPSFAVHPGAWLRTEIVEPHGLSVTIVAEKLRVTRQAMSKSAERQCRPFRRDDDPFREGLRRPRRHHDADAGGTRPGTGLGHEKEIKVERIAA